MKPPKTQRERQGVRYEQKVHARLTDLFGIERYFPSQWFAYESAGRVRYFQPDGILLLEDPRRIALVEVKYQHTLDAYWQLEHFYLPLLTHFFKRTQLPLVTVEVCKWYDPATAYPRPVKLVEQLSIAKPGTFNVHILNRPEA